MSRFLISPLFFVQPQALGFPTARAMSTHLLQPSVMPLSVSTMLMLAAAASFMPPTLVMAYLPLLFSR